MFKKNPTAENIDIAMRHFFSDDGYITDLEFFFLCPSDDWQDRFLRALESLDFSSIFWLKAVGQQVTPCHNTTIAFLEVADRFNNTQQVLSIPESWRKGIEGLIGKMNVLPNLPQLKELSPEEKLLEAIFGDPMNTPNEVLRKIENVISKLLT